MKTRVVILLLMFGTAGCLSSKGQIYNTFHDELGAIREMQNDINAQFFSSMETAQVRYVTVNAKMRAVRQWYEEQDWIVQQLSDCEPNQKKKKNRRRRKQNQGFEQVRRQLEFAHRQSSHALGASMVDAAETYQDLYSKSHQFRIWSQRDLSANYQKIESVFGQDRAAEITNWGIFAMVYQAFDRLGVSTENLRKSNVLSTTRLPQPNENNRQEIASYGLARSELSLAQSEYQLLVQRINQEILKENLYKKTEIEKLEEIRSLQQEIRRVKQRLEDDVQECQSHLALLKFNSRNLYIKHIQLIDLRAKRLQLKLKVEQFEKIPEESSGTSSDEEQEYIQESQKHTRQQIWQLIQTVVNIPHLADQRKIHLLKRFSDIFEYHDLSTQARAIAEELEAKILSDAMAHIPGGTFEMGCSNKKGSSQVCVGQTRPSRKVFVGSFYIDRTEVTVNDYSKCIEQGRCSAVKLDGCNIGKEGHGLYPMNCVTWMQAREYCEFVGKRLPTEAQWERAARSNSYDVYPWGYEEPNDTLAVFGRKRIERMKPVASTLAGAHGLFDMAGNVAEWVEDCYVKGYYPGTLRKKLRNPVYAPKQCPSQRWVVRGGSYESTPSSLVSYARAGARPQASQSFVLGVELGFRCASL